MKEDAIVRAVEQQGNHPCIFFGLFVTYLVMRKTDTGKTVLSGIFTLAHKAIEVTNSNISGAVRRKLLRYAR